MPRRLAPLARHKSPPSHLISTPHRRLASQIHVSRPQPGPQAGRKAFRRTLDIVGLLGADTASAYLGFKYEQEYRVASQNVDPRSRKLSYGTITAVEELRGLLVANTISTEDDDIQAHGYSEWSSTNIDVVAVVVAYPKNTAEVSQIAKTCTEYKISMIPYSEGSSLEANFSAPFGGVSFDFAFMDKILAMHEEYMDVVVHSGLQWMQINEQIKITGLSFPVDPGPSAKLGGMVGTFHGRIIKTRCRPRKAAAGHNLTGLFVGAEGTLGIVTKICLKLTVIPQETKAADVDFSTARDAASAAMQVTCSGVPVAAMEIMDEVRINIINRTGATNKTWKETPHLFFKFYGTTAGVKDNVSLTQTACKKNKSEVFLYAEEE